MMMTTAMMMISQVSLVHDHSVHIVAGCEFMRVGIEKYAPLWNSPGVLLSNIMSQFVQSRTA